APRHQQRADGHVAARQRFRNRHEVGLEPPVLEREQPSRAAEARLNLVHGEERPVTATQLLRTLQIAVRRQVHAHPLDRRDEDGRFSSSSASKPGRSETPSWTEPGVSSSSASINAARTRGLFRPTLNIPNPSSRSRYRLLSESSRYWPSPRDQTRSMPIVFNT